MNDLERAARIERLRELVRLLRVNAAHEGHMPYVLDAIELIVDLLERR